MQSGQMRWLANYNNVLTLRASQQGLYLASMFLFRFMAPSLLVPWSDIKVWRSKGWFFEYVTFTLGIRTGNPFADSQEACGKAARVGWQLLAR
jgi:hypothetical protein